MITLAPSDAMIEALHGFGVKPTREGDWWVAYHWFCERFGEWKHRASEYDILNGSSKCGCISSEFDALCDRDEPIRRLAYLFCHAKPNWIDLNKRDGTGKPSSYTLFLRHMKIRKWADLAKPITLPGWRPKVFPKSEWFQMKGRTFKKSPNSCHSKATSVFGFSFDLCEREGWLQWVGRICYGYPHDGSSWYVDIPQMRNESLDKFAARIDKTIDGLLVPDEWPDGRRNYEQAWQRFDKALDVLFYDDTNAEGVKALTERLSKPDNRIRLDKVRLAVLRRWVQDAK